MFPLWEFRRGCELSLDSQVDGLHLTYLIYGGSVLKIGYNCTTFIIDSRIWRYSRIYISSDLFKLVIPTGIESDIDID